MKNRNKDIDPPVYALLSDLHNFYFLSYDGTKFQCMTEITVPRERRTQFMKGMVEGMFPHYLRLPVIPISNLSLKHTVFCPAEWIY
jgi:hypothetical protein